MKHSAMIPEPKDLTFNKKLAAAGCKSYNIFYLIEGKWVPDPDNSFISNGRKKLSAMMRGSDARLKQYKIRVA